MQIDAQLHTVAQFVNCVSIKSRFLSARNLRPSEVIYFCKNIVYGDQWLLAIRFLSRKIGNICHMSHINHNKCKNTEKNQQRELRSQEHGRILNGLFKIIALLRTKKDDEE